MSNSSLFRKLTLIGIAGFLLLAGSDVAGRGKAQREETDAAMVQPEAMVGPWEAASDMGIDGIFFEIRTFSRRPAARQQIDIGVYHRQNGKEGWGWFEPNGEATAESDSMNYGRAFALFNGKRLRVHFDYPSFPRGLDPFDLDVTFSSDAQDWTGTLSRSGENLDLVLQRPRPVAGVTPNSFVGDWLGKSRSDDPFPVTGNLHLRESEDGKLCAWLNTDQISGQWLRIDSVSDTSITLEPSNDTAPIFHYVGNVSEGGEVVTGVWGGGDGIRMTAPDIFVRTSSVGPE
ncbi:MAG TPA: hypothetical protein VIY69_06420 [Candidatus Acidoferrales bacterium]